MFFESDLPLAEQNEIDEVIADARAIIRESHNRATESFLAKVGRIAAKGIVEYGLAVSGIVGPVVTQNTYPRET